LTILNIDNVKCLIDACTVFTWVGACRDRGID